MNNKCFFYVSYVNTCCFPVSRNTQQKKLNIKLKISRLHANKTIKWLVLELLPVKSLG